MTAKQRANRVLNKYLETIVLFFTILLFANICLVSCGKHKLTVDDFAESLLDKNICTGENFKRLEKDIEAGAIKSGFQLVQYCDKGKIIELENYSDDPEVYLEQIHKDVAALMPELSFTDFKFEILLDTVISDSSFQSYNVIVSLNSNGKPYQQKSFISPKDIGKYKGMKYFGKIDQQEFYNIFNKILADHQSPYRLHEVKSFGESNSVDWDKFGIISLTKEQADLLHGKEVYFAPGYESFRNSLTSKTIEKAIEGYKKIGLFDHLSEDQISKSTELALQESNQNLNDLLTHFPDVVSEFDLEMINTTDPYNELTKEFSKISHGAFNPQDIQDNFSNPHFKRVNYKFRLNGKSYGKDLKYQKDWADPEFITIIQKAVDENKLGGQFYDLYESGQGAILIFLTPAQHDFLKENKLLVFAEDWQSQE